MAISNTVIQIKKSVTSGNVPSTLANGEIAINTVDGKLFYSKPDGTINFITNSQSFATVNANSSLILATSPTDTLTLVGVNGITVSACTSSKTITIGSTGTGGGSGGSSNAFSNISVAGYSSILASSTSNTLTFVSQTGIALATDPANSTLTIATNLIGASNVIVDYGTVTSTIGTISFDYGTLS